MDNPLENWTIGDRNKLRAMVADILETFTATKAHDAASVDRAMTELAKVGELRPGGRPLLTGEAARLLDAIQAVVRAGAPTVDAMTYTIAAFLDGLSKPRARTFAPRFSSFLRDDVVGLTKPEPRPELKVSSIAALQAMTPADGMTVDVLGVGIYRFAADAPGDLVAAAERVEHAGGQWVCVGGAAELI